VLYQLSYRGDVRYRANFRSIDQTRILHSADVDARMRSSRMLGNRGAGRRYAIRDGRDLQLRGLVVLRGQPWPTPLRGLGSGRPVFRPLAVTTQRRLEALPVIPPLRPGKLKKSLVKQVIAFSYL
jgi:hypothetical protein